jgi:hypothetical protein
MLTLYASALDAGSESALTTQRCTVRLKETESGSAAQAVLSFYEIRKRTDEFKKAGTGPYPEPVNPLHTLTLYLFKIHYKDYPPIYAKVSQVAFFH